MFPVCPQKHKKDTSFAQACLYTWGSPIPTPAEAMSHVLRLALLLVTSIAAPPVLSQKDLFMIIAALSSGSFGEPQSYSPVVLL